MEHGELCGSSAWSTTSCVYVTLLAGAPHANSTSRRDKAVVTRNGSRSNDRYFRQTVCLQQRLRTLNATYPLVVLHNFDEDLSP